MLYLHIGTEKAGSTTIQDFLLTNFFGSCKHELINAWGIGNSWKLAAFSHTDDARSQLVGRLNLATDAEFDEIRVNLMDEVRSEIERSRKSADFVASSEYIWNHYGAEKERIEELAAALTSIFGTVRIIFYCRDQKYYLSSSYAQAVKGARRTTKTFSTYLKDMEGRSHLTDYYSTLCLWADVFGEDNIRARVFSKTAFYRGDLLADFLKTVEDDELAGSIDVTLSGASNISPNNFQIDLIRYTNLIPRGYWRLRKLSQRILTVILSPRLSNIGSKQPRNISRRKLNSLRKNNALFNARFLRDTDERLPEADMLD